tara:strand:+ start:135 stop:530 length:396 start_codon:yes stop_codon:yes gene_type:complete
LEALLHGVQDTFGELSPKVSSPKLLSSKEISVFLTTPVQLHGRVFTILPTPPEPCGFLERRLCIRINCNPAAAGLGMRNVLVARFVCVATRLLDNPPIMPKWVIWLDKEAFLLTRHDGMLYYIHRLKKHDI